MSDIEKKVLKEIQQSGLPTEIKTTKILKDFEWSVFNEYPYSDKDTSIIRTLDIKATKSFKKLQAIKTVDLPQFGPRIELFIECKKAHKELWAFYTETYPLPYFNLTISRSIYDALQNVEVISGFIKKNKKNKKIIKNPSVFSKIPLNYEKINVKIALSQQNVFHRNDSFREAQMQILKALWHIEQENTTKNLENSDLKIVIPIIIFNGRLFECYYGNNKLITSEINHVRYLAHGLPNQNFPALIDVLTLDHFPQYLKLIEKEFFSQ